MAKVMLAVDKETKQIIRNIQWPGWLKSDDAKIRYLVEMYNNVRGDMNVNGGTNG